MKKQSVIKFNHISTSLTPERIEELSKMYMYYHKLSVCYRWMHKRLKKVKLVLNMTSVGLTVTGVIVGGVTLNPIILGAVSGPGVMIQAYLTKSNLSRKVDGCKYAYTSYDKIMIQLRSFLRGMPYDEVVFLSDAKVLEDTIEDLCPAVSERCLKKYKIRYGV